MNFLAILGSPRAGGNTDILLEEALRAAREKRASITKINLNELSVKPCQECRTCHGTGVCSVKDDMVFVYKRIDEADRVIVASPIYFGSISAQTKIMVDRMQCIWARKFLLKKTSGRKRDGGFISCGGLKRGDYFSCAAKVIKIFFLVHDITYKEELFAQGLDKPGDIMAHKDILKKAYGIGERLAGSV